MPRGILTKEQRERQLAGINSIANRKRLSEVSKLMWATKDMTERNKKVSESRKGEKHPLWKGNNVGYEGLHEWVRNNYDVPDRCDNCLKKGKVDSANVSGKYKRERRDWKFLCRKCHMLSDNRLTNLIKRNKL